MQWWSHTGFGASVGLLQCLRQWRCRKWATAEDDSTALKIAADALSHALVCAAMYQEASSVLV